MGLCGGSVRTLPDVQKRLGSAESVSCLLMRNCSGNCFLFRGYVC